MSAYTGTSRSTWCRGAQTFTPFYEDKPHHSECEQCGYGYRQPGAVKGSRCPFGAHANGVTIKYKHGERIEVMCPYYKADPIPATETQSTQPTK